MADDFVFADEIWFIAPKSPIRSLDELCLAILRGAFQDAATGHPIPIVYVFSDSDLAFRHLERTKAPPQYQPFSPDGDARVIALLERLATHGDEYLGIDIEQSSGVIRPIASVIDHLRRRA